MRRRKQAREARLRESAAGADDSDAAPRVQDSGRVALFDEEEEVDANLRVNEKFKKRFEHNEGLKDKMRLKELTQELGEDGDSTSSEEEDSEGELLTEEVNANILETLAKIKNKDPAIYKADVKFFDDADDDAEDEGEGGGGGAPEKATEETKKKKKAQKLTVVDMERERLLRGDAGADDDSDSDQGGGRGGAGEGYYEAQKRVKAEFMGAADEASSDDELFKPRVRTAEEQRQEDKEFDAFAKDRLAEQARDPAQTLRTLLTEDALDDDELFLRNYVLG